QSRLAVEAMTDAGRIGTVRLKMIKLSGAGAWDEEAPDVSPTVDVAVELDDVSRFRVLHTVVQQQAHGGRRAAEHRELHAPVANRGAVGVRVGELSGTVDRFNRHCWHNQRWGF